MTSWPETPWTLTDLPMKKNFSIQSVQAILLWFAYLFSTLFVACTLAWHLLAQVNFAFPAAYRVLDINQHIGAFGPQNRYKHHFEKTTDEERFRVFGEIVTAIQHHGKGLADIQYQVRGHPPITLLREAEVIHLKDVANLIDAIYLTAGGCLIVAIISLLGLYKKRVPPPSFKQALLGLVVFVATVLIILFSIGPKEVFYWLHIQIFPEDHEWFFYYQDSLMTTLMKAPDLFGFIGALIALLGLIFYSLTMYLTMSLLNKTTTGSLPEPTKTSEKRIKR